MTFTATLTSRSVVLAGLILGLVTFAPQAPASADDTARSFVQTLANEALELVVDDRPEADKREDFAILLDRYFDMRGIAQFLVGRYWRTASEMERDAYYDAFHDSIVTTYTRRFSDYSGQELRVTGSREDGRFLLVSSEIVSPDGQGQPVKVDWRLMPQDGRSYKVVDVVIEGVSMSVTQRQEYTSLIQSRGGGLPALTEALNQNTRRTGGRGG